MEVAKCSIPAFHLSDATNRSAPELVTTPSASHSANTVLMISFWSVTLPEERGKSLYFASHAPWEPADGPRGAYIEVIEPAADYAHISLLPCN